MLPEWIALLPWWLRAGLAAGAGASALIAGVFLLAGRLLPAPTPDRGGGSSRDERRAGEISDYLSAVGEPFLTDHTVRGETVAFYLPDRDVAITFDPRAYFRLAETPTHAVLCEHEMPGVNLGRRLPFETPEPGPRPDAEAPVEAAFRRLGLPAGADADAVTAAYRARVKEVHPDHGGDPEEFHRVREAYARAREHAD